MADFISETMTSGFIYNPHYRTQCITLNAQADPLPRGSIICVKSTADGTFDLIGASSGDYDTHYGVLLNDVPASVSTQPVDVVVAGELFYQYVNAVYADANGGSDLAATDLVALRNIGIILK